MDRWLPSRRMGLGCMSHLDAHNHGFGSLGFNEAPMIRPTLCAVCRAHANSGHGFGFRGQKHIHACRDYRCRELLPKVYNMSKDTLDAYDLKAMDEGGGWAGSYLDQIGKYNLGELTAEEWGEFCMRMIAGYQDGIRRMIANDEAPF